MPALVRVLSRVIHVRLTTLRFFMMFDLGYEFVEPRNSGSDVASSIRSWVKRPLTLLVFYSLGKTPCLVGIEQFLQPRALCEGLRLVHAISKLVPEHSMVRLLVSLYMLWPALSMEA